MAIHCTEEKNCFIILIILNKNSLFILIYKYIHLVYFIPSAQRALIELRLKL